MPDSNRVALLYVPESTFGVTPASPTMSFARFTSESLRQETQSTSSQEIRFDRQVPDVIRTDLNAAGDLNWELSAPSGATPDTPNNMFDSFFRAALLSSAWSAIQTVTGNIDAAAGDNSFNSTALFGALNAGQWIRASGFINVANNGYFKIISKPSSSKIIVAGQLALVTEASASRTLVQGPQIVNGTTFQSFTIEKRYTDLVNEFAYLRGMAIDTMNLNVQRGAIITGGFGFMGVRETSGTATLAASTNAASTTDVMNGVDDVVNFMENYAAGANDFDITSFSLSLQNNLRALTQVGSLGAVEMGTGTVNVTGTVQAYFRTKAIFDRYLNFGSTSLALITQRTGTTGGWVVDLPRVKFTSGQRVAGGLNQDIIADLQFTAFRNPTEDATIRVARFV